MKKFVFVSAMGVLAATGAHAQEATGRVISSTPVIQQVAVPRQICNNQPVVVEQPRSGAGSAIGAIAGGLIGNTIGHGNGRAAATVLGVIGGAVVGDRVEANGAAQVQNVQQCSTQTFYENRAVAYDVTYEYAGRQYTVQMPQDPGPTVRLQVTPVGANAPQSQNYVAGEPQPAVVAPAQVVTVPSTVVYPAYYYRPYYYPPVGVSLNFGYYGGHHRHWR
jgi:uncharacterized protein YcfJ